MSDDELAAVIGQQLKDELHTRGLRYTRLSVVNFADTNFDFRIEPIGANTQDIFKYVGIERWRYELEQDGTFTAGMVSRMVDCMVDDYNWMATDD